MDVHLVFISSAIDCLIQITLISIETFLKTLPSFYLIYPECVYYC